VSKHIYCQAIIRNENAILAVPDAEHRIAVSNGTHRYYETRGGRTRRGASWGCMINIIGIKTYSGLRPDVHRERIASL
jgi:hypothetical protein